MIVEIEEDSRDFATVYKKDYLGEKDRARIDVTLPQDWIIPETIQKRAYRNPWIIATRDLIKPPKIVKPPNNLDPNLKEREILRVTTNNSEYTNTIGVTGERIILESPSNMKEYIASQESLKKPEITESECSLILKQNLVLPSKIF
ncbi:hypothetical protein RF55_7008 [Lasius niger]|uniref:Uncharacterized protein n=1 Tax=Lasius niger TaxID=67767 RepID=A0A0J7KRE4_LASNI|nr:hypothetical protein RF55_7008 [Lasius niger]